MIYITVKLRYIFAGTEQTEAPVATCSYSFVNAVMATVSKLMFLNDIYLVLKNEIYKNMFLEHFTYITCGRTHESVRGNWKFR